MTTITMIREWTERHEDGEDHYAEYEVNGLRLQHISRYDCGPLTLPVDQPVDHTWATYSPELRAAIRALAAHLAGGGVPVSEEDDDGARREQLLDQACEEGQIAGAAPADL